MMQKCEHCNKSPGDTQVNIRVSYYGYMNLDKAISIYNDGDLISHLLEENPSFEFECPHCDKWSEF